MDYNLIADRPGRTRAGATSAAASWSPARTTPRRPSRSRLRDYHEKTEPVLDLFRRKEFVVTVDARPDKITVQQSIRHRLGLPEYVVKED